VFVSFEGADGSGKSTQAELLRASLAAAGREVVLTREPGGTELGERIRELLLEGPDMSPWAEATLFAASRAQHVDELIQPALERGADVVCDRYVDSSLAYQGIARGLGRHHVGPGAAAGVERHVHPHVHGPVGHQLADREHLVGEGNLGVGAGECHGGVPTCLRRPEQSFIGTQSGGGFPHRRA